MCRKCTHDLKKLCACVNYQKLVHCPNKLRVISAAHIYRVGKSSTRWGLMGTGIPKPLSPIPTNDQPLLPPPEGGGRSGGGWGPPTQHPATSRRSNKHPALQRTNSKNWKQIFPEKELRDHNFHIHVSVSDLYIPTIDLPFLMQEICGPILEIYKSLTDT